MHYLSPFFKRFNKACVILSRVWMNNTICRRFEKIFKNYLLKIDKNALFLAYFKKLQNSALKFCASTRKTLFSGDFGQNFRKFS